MADPLTRTLHGLLATSAARLGSIALLSLLAACEGTIGAPSPFGLVEGDARIPSNPQAGDADLFPGSPMGRVHDGGMAQGVLGKDAGMAPSPALPKPDAQTPPAPPAPVPPMGMLADPYYVEDGLLYDGCGEELVMRGVNHPTLYVDRAGKAMPEIARSGANAVRLFWFAKNGIAIGEAEASIQASVKSGLLPILEMHDSTCKWELDAIVDYWTSSEAVALIEKHERHLIVNIANETSPPSPAAFVDGYGAAIERMRMAGIRVPLMIDGGRCGRDHTLLLDKGAELLERDPDHNLIFSAHLYDPLTQPQLGATFDGFRKAKLAFVVGEFANKEPPGCGKPLDYAGLIEEAERAGIGWLAWSWGDDNPMALWNADCGEFDMTSTFSFDTLLGWGKEVTVTHPASILNTADRPYALTHGDRCR